jgi:hypothetical protein
MKGNWIWKSSWSFSIVTSTLENNIIVILFSQKNITFIIIIISIIVIVIIIWRGVDLLLGVEAPFHQPIPRDSCNTYRN